MQVRSRVCRVVVGVEKKGKLTIPGYFKLHIGESLDNLIFYIFMELFISRKYLCKYVCNTKYHVQCNAKL